MFKPKGDVQYSALLTLDVEQGIENLKEKGDLDEDMLMVSYDRY